MENEFYNEYRNPSQKDEGSKECIEGGGKFTIFEENKCLRQMFQIKIFHSKILEGDQDDRGAQQNDGRFLIFPTEGPIREGDRFKSIHEAFFLS